ncbi:ABC transporter ATP-binding protein [Aromatoleum toluclasticum]|uniref:ABC transporter ATP-binding protein n=1 Tax=Aromatoleum toluclasticum TaxID=92003 RepID=UPI00036981C3|nr:ABC transporter ATP-binding protein [Aromatoleum toluclasticum]
MGSISVSNLGKAYKQYPTRWSRLLEWITPGHKPHHTLRWVLQDVSFSVEPGESVGIVGVNGAGKSTLLKMITGTTQPTTGGVHVNGRIAALLELGMGFHPDFTGRQNVFMAGQLQGLTVRQLMELMPEIERFADIGDYIDQPVRVFSSGMQVRLAFAVATALRPDILIVDEALAVGDAAFQRKCFRRIEEFRAQGTTLLFVSHDVDCVKKLCSKALFLKDGCVAAFGVAKTVCDMYEKALFGGLEGISAGVDIDARLLEPLVDESLMSNCEVAYGDGRAVIEAIWLENERGERANVFGSRGLLVLKYRVRFNEAVGRIAFAFMAKTRDGVALFGMDTSHMPEINGRAFALGDIFIARFELENAFAPGVYYINCGIRDDSADPPVFLHRRVDSVLFRVKSDELTFVKSGVINTVAAFELASA